VLERNWVVTIWISSGVVAYDDMFGLDEMGDPELVGHPGHIEKSLDVAADETLEADECDPASHLSSRSVWAGAANRDEPRRTAESSPAAVGRGCVSNTDALVPARTLSTAHAGLRRDGWYDDDVVMVSAQKLLRRVPTPLHPMVF
jgi:hypothetical protein